jgi:hypothetical protein
MILTSMQVDALHIITLHTCSLDADTLMVVWEFSTCPAAQVQTKTEDALLMSIVR